MDTTTQWTWWLWSAIEYFTSLWWTVSVPLIDSQKYDLIVDNKKKLLKVQVKTSTYKYKDKYYEVQLASKHNYWNKRIEIFDKSATDYLYILLWNWDRYLIPSKKMDCKHIVKIRNKYFKFKI